MEDTNTGTIAKTTVTPASVGDPTPRPADGETPAQMEAAIAAEQKGALATEAYAQGREGLDEENEKDALDFLLAPKPRRLYNVPTEYDTEDGLRKLTFVVFGMDGRKLDDIETRNRNPTTGMLDQITTDCEIVAEACVFMETSKQQVKINSPEFLTVKIPDPDNPGQLKDHVLASPAMALEARFKTQLGLLMGVARAVRIASGYDVNRVGVAQRRLVTAAGN